MGTWNKKQIEEISGISRGLKAGQNRLEKMGDIREEAKL